MELQHIYGDPYKNFEPWEKDTPDNWDGYSDEFISKMIKKYKPELVIEVGSWLGASAINMAKTAKKSNLDTKIICVDTWLGSVEMTGNQTEQTSWLNLFPKNGYPSVYYRFLSNVIHDQVQDKIYPFPQTSLNAAILFSLTKVKADMIYIDAGHEYENVIADIKAYWPILKNGGIMFGDDFNQSWPGLIKAVNEFSVYQDVEFEIHKNLRGDDNYWTIQK